LTNPKQTATIENNQALFGRFPRSGGFSTRPFKKEGFSMEKGLNEILTFDEATDLLRIPCSTVYKLAQLGKIPAQKVGRHWRFHRATLILGCFQHRATSRALGFCGFFESFAILAVT
jgi:excisionase family DNA binding protein